MGLREYDGMCVRIVLNEGDVYEGFCSHNSAEYGEHEFGRAEESLQILSFLIFKSEIRDVESLEGREGPYGMFSEPYGALEEMTVEEGIDAIAEVLFSEETEHICRVLCCLEKYFLPGGSYRLTCRAPLIDVLKELLTVSQDARIRDGAETLLDMAAEGGAEENA